MQKRRIIAKGKERKLKKWKEIKGVSKKTKERSSIPNNALYWSSRFIERQYEQL